MMTTMGGEDDFGSNILSAIKWCLVLMYLIKINLRTSHSDRRQMTFTHGTLEEFSPVY